MLHEEAVVDEGQVTTAPLEVCSPNAPITMRTNHEGTEASLASAKPSSMPLRHAPHPPFGPSFVILGPKSSS